MTDGNKAFCVICLSDKTSGKWWRHNKEGQTVCWKCYLKYVWEGHKQSVKKDNDKRNPKHLLFKNRVIVLSYNPRKGVCTQCGRKRGEGVKSTSIHHIEYFIIFPWFGTVELCNSCHGFEGIRLGQAVPVQLYNIKAPRDPKTGRFTKIKNG